MDAAAVLSLSPVFRALDRKALRLMAESAEWRELGGGHRLYRPGDPGDALYLIVSGRLRMYRVAPNGDERSIGDLGLGETVGVMSVVTGESRSATVMALRDSTLLRISKARFEQLVRRYPEAMLSVTRLIVDRLRDRRTPVARDSVRSSRTYALLPAHDGIDIRAFSQSFCRQLGHAGSVLRLDAERVDAALGEGCAATSLDAPEGNRDLVTWLNRLEDRYRYVVYQASARPQAWTRRCLRQADRIIVIAQTRRQADTASANLAWLDESGVRAPVELALMTGAEANSGPLDWRNRCGSDSHFLMQPDAGEAPMGRLARLVSGRGLCLVLGGGGARGFAHLGLLRALHEKGVTVDAVGGTSMGALVAAMAASGMSIDAMLDALRETFVANNYLNDYSISRISLIGAKKFRSRLEALFGDARIENLPLPFYCLSTNISTGRPMVHTTGRLSDWVGTSMAVPGIAPPTVYRGELLVDGGVLQNLPVDTMLRWGRGAIIASEVSHGAPLRFDSYQAEEPESLSNIPDARKEINIFNILFQTATLSGDGEARGLDPQTDLLLQMPVEGIGLFDWDRLDDIVYRAYHHADEVLDRWLTREGLTGPIPADVA